MFTFKWTKKSHSYSDARSFFLIVLVLACVASSNALAQCPEKPDWVDSVDPETCDFIVDGIVFKNSQLLTGHTAPGSKKPSCRDELNEIGKCTLCNALWWDNHVNTAAVGADLSNPNYKDNIKYWVIKDSLHEGTVHIPGGHEDLLQPRQAINDGGWLIIQDSVFKNAGTNAFIHVGSSGPGYSDGGRGEYACEGEGTGGVLFQGLDMALYDPGYTGNNQIGIGGVYGAQLGEVWLVGMDYRQGIGIAIWDDTGKVVVIGGSGGDAGWPGPLSRRFLSGEPMTEETCPNNGWRNGQCCPNGLVNTQGQVFSWDGSRGDDPADGAIPIYCYDDIETALAHTDGNGQPLHQAPPLIGKSDTGWSSRGWVNESGASSGTDPTPQPVKLQTPILEPAGGPYIQQTQVSITSSAGATIHYTLDGSLPTAASPIYSQPILLSTTTVVQAIALGEGSADSEVASDEYIIGSYLSQDEWDSIEVLPFSTKRTLAFNITPLSNNIDSVVGLGDTPAQNYSDMAALVRFAPNGIIDARNGAVYTDSLDVPLAYEANQTYAVAMIVDIQAGKYDVLVTTSGGTQYLLADNFDFRSDFVFDADSVSDRIFDYVSFRTIEDTGTSQRALIESIFLPAPPTPFNLRRSR